MFCNDFKLNINDGTIDNPFFISNLTTWEDKKLLSVDEKWLTLLEKKNKLIDSDLPIKTSKIFVIDNEYEIKYIDPEYLAKELKLDKVDKKKLTPNEVRQVILDYVDKGLLTEHQYQLVFSIIKYFDVSTTGLLYPKKGVSKGVSKLTTNTEEERYKYYKDIIGLPFGTYYREVIEFAKVNNLDLDIVKKEIDNYTIRRQIDAGYINNKLPNKYLPLVARNSFVGPDGKNFIPSIWQSYFMYHEPEKRMNLVVTNRQAGKFGGVKRQIYRMSDGTFKRIEDLKVGDKLLASDKKGYVNVKGIEKTYEPVYKIGLKNGLTLYTTEEHEVVTSKNYKDGKFEGPYITAKELKGDEFIPVMYNLGIDGVQEDLVMAKLLGYWLGDGHKTLAHKGSIAISTGVNSLYMEHLVKYCEQAGLKYRIGDYRINENGTNRNIIIYGFIDYFLERYGNTFTKMFHKKSTERYIPTEVFGWNKESKLAFIEGIIGSDGYLSGHNTAVSIEYTTMSEDLAEDLMILLADVGIIARVKDNVIIKDEGGGLELEYQWIQIDSIERIEEKEVYHVEVDGDNLLWVGAILTHNSAISSIVSLILLLSEGRGDILFVVPSEEFIYQPMQYFERFAQKFKKHGLIKIKKSENTVECPITGNSLKFASSLSKSGGRSQSAPYIIFDEASYIKDEVFERVLPIFLGKGGKFYAFSTINWQQKRENSEWFFKWSKWIELGKKYDLGGGEQLDLSEIGNVLRVTVDEVEWKDKMEVQLLKMSLKDKPEKYFAELYATLPTNDGLFTTEGFWMSPELYKKKYFSINNNFIIGYDPAKLQDMGGLIVMDATNGVIIEELPLKNVNYLQQIDIIKRLIAKYNNAQLVFDRTRDETTYEILIEKGIRPISIKYTAGGEVKRNPKDMWSYNVPKKVLVDTFETLVEKGDLHALGTLTLLQEEIQNFKAFTTASGNVKYEAQAGTDDTINAVFVASFYYNILKKGERLTQKKKASYDVEARLRRLEDNQKRTNDRYKKYIY